MTRNILVGYNTENEKQYWQNCEVFSTALQVGDTYKGETIEEVEDFDKPTPKTSDDITYYTCQIVTTANYHDVAKALAALGFNGVFKQLSMGGWDNNNNRAYMSCYGESSGSFWIRTGTVLGNPGFTTCNDIVVRVN